jgi:acetyltransferase-like isoleucine patch superfamily enzyme
MLLLLKFFVLFLPWPVKRLFLCYFFGYDLDRRSYIGISWIYPSKLIMKSYAKIGSLNVAIHLDRIEMEECSTIGRSNWITGFSTKGISRHFIHQVNRSSALILGAHSAITKHHHIDCTDKIVIGHFTTVAGYDSQFLTHSINIYTNRQESNPIIIGDYNFIGTNVTILGGSILPSYSVLGANSLLNKTFNEKYALYGGNPAVKIKDLAKESKYFLRERGFVN